MFAYMLAETTMITWLVVYGQESLGLTIVTASKLLSVFWISVIFGRILASFVLKYVKSEVYVIFATLLAGGTLVLFSAIDFDNIYIEYLFIIFTGIGFSALYSTLTSLGTIQIGFTSPRLVSLLLGAGCLGTISAPLITSIIKEKLNLNYVFGVCSLFMFLIAIMTFCLLIRKINLRKNFFGLH